TRFSRDWSSDVCSSDLFEHHVEPSVMDSLQQIGEGPWIDVVGVLAQQGRLETRLASASDHPAIESWRREMYLGRHVGRPGVERRPRSFLCGHPAVVQAVMMMVEHDGQPGSLVDPHAVRDGIAHLIILDDQPT